LVLSVHVHAIMCKCVLWNVDWMADLVRGEISLKESLHEDLVQLPDGGQEAMCHCGQWRVSGRLCRTTNVPCSLLGNFLPHARNSLVYNGRAWRGWIHTKIIWAWINESLFEF
jgi:hypothetical protein